MKFWKNPAHTLLNLWRTKKPPTLQSHLFYSFALERDVNLDIYLPPEYTETQNYPLILFNDGQDLPRMDFAEILGKMYAGRKIPPFIAVGIHAGDERHREYGTARQPDYKGRGDKAGRYHFFVLKELLPFLYRQYSLTELATERAIAGFSLGGLSAFDIGWANQRVFGTIGVFSGALWWRWSHVHPSDPDADRILHDIVQQTLWVDKNQYFWFQCGTLDEEDDRNNNGVIDAIDDTLDLIKVLHNKGFREESVRYLEIENGKHDPDTWGEAMPDFLEWALVDG